MTNNPLNFWLLNMVLKMPQWFQRPLKRLGVYSEALDLYERLYTSKNLSSFPLTVRKHRIRKLITRYHRGRDIGSHVPGFYPFLIPASSWAEYPDLLFSKGMAPPQTILPLVARRTHPTAIADISLGLHIHAFYIDGLESVRDAILQNKTLPELYITGPNNICNKVYQIFSDYPEPINFIACDNIGRDIVPFLKLLPTMRTAGHDLIGHVHIKKSIGVRTKRYVNQWSVFLLSSMIGEPLPGGAAIDNIAAHFTGSSDRPVLYVPHMSDPEGWGFNLEIAKELFPSVYAGSLPDRFVFSPGTVFWATPGYLRPFESLNLPWELLVPEPLPSDGTILHAIERLFGALAFAQQDSVAICVPDTVSFVHSQKLMKKYT